MRTEKLPTTRQGNLKNQPDPKHDTLIMQFIAVIVIVFLLSVSILGSVYAQKGELKVKGYIENVSNDEVRSLITLYQIQETSSEPTILGQYLVHGNDWFKTTLLYDKTYLIDIASDNGMTKRFVFRTDVPSEWTDLRQKLEFSIDMKSTTDQWPVLAEGFITFSDKENTFVNHDVKTMGDAMFALNPK